MKYSVIDIGSNSVRLMTWANGTTLYKRISTTRLGEGIAFSPVLKAEAIERTAAAVAAFYAQARAENATVYAFATAAVRTAENGGEFCRRVKELCGLTVDVVGGEREAELALSGALGKGDGSVIDIGGVSTEICTRRQGVRDLAVSVDIGAVRLYDLCRDDPAMLRNVIGEKLAALRGIRPVQPVYAVGGTATTVAALMQGLDAYYGEKINDFPMTAADVGAWAQKLLTLSPEERAAQRGMDPKRADIIAGGALLLFMLMKKLGVGCVYASDRDNLEGYLTEKLS